MLVWVLPALVNVRFAPLPLPQALERLSAATGEKLECAPVFQNEVLLVRLKDADESRTLAEVARLFDARWETRENRKVLLPDGKAIARRAEAKQARDRAILRGSLAYLKRRRQGMPQEYGTAEAEAQRTKKAREEAARKEAEAKNDAANMFTASAAQEETPAWRAASRILLDLGETALSPLPPNSRTVWAERPTHAQRPFSPATTAILAQYRKELRAFDPQAEIVRTRLVAQAWEDGGAFNVTFQGVDAGGNVVDQAFLRMNDDMDRLKARSTVFDKPAPLPGEAPLPYAPETLEYAKVLNVDSRDRVDLLPKWRAILTDPVAYEPTGWFPGGRLVDAAERLDKNLIGVPSELTGISYDDRPTLETPSQFLKRTYGIVERDDWLFLEGYNGARRPARSRARTLLTKAIGEGGVSVDDAASWIAKESPEYGFLGWMGDTLGALLTNGGPYSARAGLSSEALPFWDALGVSNRQALREGRTLDLSRLPSAAKEWIFKSFYWEGSDEGEPTERLPDGIDGGSLRLTVEETPLIVASSSREGDDAASMVMTAEMLGRFLEKGNPYWEIDRSVYLAYDRYRVGTSRAYRLRFLLGPQSIPLETSLSETFFSPDTPLLTRLPKTLEEKVRLAREKAGANP